MPIGVAVVYKDGNKDWFDPVIKEGDIMKIQKVAVTYGELRSKGSPNFSNERYELMLEALIEPGETAESVRILLTEAAKYRVRTHFAGQVVEDQMDVPF